jgi:hypothetical protein
MKHCVGSGDVHTKIKTANNISNNLLPQINKGIITIDSNKENPAPK